MTTRVIKNSEESTLREGGRCVLSVSGWNDQLKGR